MVAIAKRMAKLRTRLLNIRLGPGAAVLPPSVSRLHMNFNTKYNDGHLGPRKFWQQMLPRLKYHNPAIPMTVSRSEDTTGPATLSVTFDAPAEAPRVETINMQHRHESAILAELVKLTGGVAVKPTPAESEEMARLERRRELGERDRVAERERLEGVKRREAILKGAREG